MEFKKARRFLIMAHRSSKLRAMASRSSLTLDLTGSSIISAAPCSVSAVASSFDFAAIKNSRNSLLSGGWTNILVLKPVNSEVVLNRKNI